MANSKFNLAKGEEKNNINLSKSEEPKASKFNLSKEPTPAASTLSSADDNKKSKWWLWLLSVLAIVVVILFLWKPWQSSEIKTEDFAATPTDVNSPTESTGQTPVAELSKAEVTPTEEGVASESPAQQTNEETSKPAVTPVQSTKPEAAQSTAQSSNNASKVASGDVEQLANEVIQGRYGNGEERKQQLGNRYSEIQRKVNEKYLNGEVI